MDDLSKVGLITVLNSPPIMIVESDKLDSASKKKLWKKAVVCIGPTHVYNSNFFYSDADDNILPLRIIHVMNKWNFLVY